jgi:hypothetical protein
VKPQVRTAGALDGATEIINRELEARARDLAGLKGYVTEC